MSVWILILAFSSYSLTFSHAAELYMDNLDPLWSDSVIDPTSVDLSGDLFADANIQDTGSDIFDPFLNNDTGLDLSIGPTLISDCSSPNDSDYSTNKARRRRRQICRNHASDPTLPDLSLPNLEQNFLSGSEYDPHNPQRRPATTREKKVADMLNNLSLNGGTFLRAVDSLLNTCQMDEQKFCSSNNPQETQTEVGGQTYSLTNPMPSKYCPSHR